MGTRITHIGATVYTVWVNSQEQVPTYNEKARAIHRAEREAATHRHVLVTRSTGGRSPKTIAAWENGQRTV